MTKVLVKIPSSPSIVYPILIDSGLLSNPSSWLPQKYDFEDIVIITDFSVQKLYGQALAKSLKKIGHRVLLLSFPAGENSKNQQTKQFLEEKMLSHGCGRQTLCLALGGGVTGDIAGFIAATYMRGISFLQIPTTFLAMVDSSVGGKTAIDTPFGKNLIGAFWQPKKVIIDTCCLKSLPKQHLINGLIEAIKMTLTSDKKSFQFIQKNLNQCVNAEEKILKNIIQRAVKIKAKVVAEDERERSGPRLILNFGHTIGHALEKITDYKVLHGFAVAYGLLVEAKISELEGILPASDYAIIAALFAKLDIFPQDLKKYSIEKIIQAAKQDKKNKNGKTHYVLLKTIGEVYTRKSAYAHRIADATVKLAFQMIVEVPYGRK